ncbi:MAG: hypothetical protein LBI66_09915 [Burkholderiaceae bacterium]|jgi:hypothetical protein|nr:hypothetical protein [Burkholderiaceae bacterium]
MDLFHTSPVKIDKIHTSGRFGEFLFFSDRVYVMTAGSFETYKLELNDDDVIRASRLFFHEDAEKLQPLVTELAARLGVSEEDAEALIEESKSAHDIDSIEPEDAADASWDVQLFTARAAKALGYRAVQVSDETGFSWMVDMLGREADLAAA